MSRTKRRSKRWFRAKVAVFLLAWGTIPVPAAADAAGTLPDERTEPAVLGHLWDGERRAVELYREVAPTVVSVMTSKRVLSGGDQEHQGVIGSGVVISSDSHVLTAAHVVDGADIISVKTRDGVLHTAELIFSETGADVALLRIVPPEPTLKPARLGDSDSLLIGQMAYVVGNPYGLENSFTIGYISGFRDGKRVYDGTIPTKLIQTDAAINSGNSGGPVFNSSGELIGIASRIVSVSGGSQGLGLIVAINTAKALLSLENRSWMGIEAVFLGRRQLAELMNLDREGGMLVQRVASGSPAEKAGLRGGSVPARISGHDTLLGGDLILEFGTQEACHSECLLEARGRLQAMERIPVRFLREGKIMETVIDVSATRRSFLK